MQVGVYDGEGYSNAPGDPGKDVEGRVSIRPANTDLGGRAGGVRLTGYGQVEPGDRRHLAQPLHRRASRTSRQ